MTLSSGFLIYTFLRSHCKQLNGCCEEIFNFYCKKQLSCFFESINMKFHSTAFFLWINSQKFSGHVHLSSLILTYLPFQFVPTALTLDSGVTRPPPLLSESDLLSCMDKVEIIPTLKFPFTFHNM